MASGGDESDEKVAASGPAPRVFVTYAYDSEDHQENVLKLCTLLCESGIDARIDKWAGSRRRNWRQWTTQEIDRADFVLVIASPAYWRAADCTDPDNHRGAQAEAELLADRLHQDRETWTPKILPVIFPEWEVTHIPSFLSPFNCTHFEVTEFTVAGAEELLRALTGDPPYYPPELGSRRVFPPRTLTDPTVARGPRTSTRGKRAGTELETLREISEAAVRSCDVVAQRDGRPWVRLSDGAYVRRTVETRLLERLAEPTVTAVVGEAGHGKTALLWQLHRLLAEAGRLPLFVPASAMISAPPARPVITVDLVDEAVRQGQWTETPLVLLVDTLDLLLHSVTARAQVNRLLSVASQHRLPTLVTTRPVESRWLEIDYGGLGDAPEHKRTIKGVTLGGFDRAERPAAIGAYARAFYPEDKVAEVIQDVENASVRGLPLQEVCSNPLALRLMFELYAAADELPPIDIDTIGLYDQYWYRRVEHDDRGSDTAATGPDLSRPTEAVGVALLADGAIEAGKPHLVERIRPLVPPASGGAAADAVDMLRSRGVLHTPPDSARLRFFHQTFFEYAAARGVAQCGPSAFQVLMNRVRSDPLDLLSGEVAAQVLLLAERTELVARAEADQVLEGWLDAEEPSLRAAALRTYARRRLPGTDLRDHAMTSLDSGDLDAVKGYIALLPSVYHSKFDRPRAELSILWRRADEMQQLTKTAKEGRQLALNVLNALSRLSATHPEESIRFLADHGCIDWLASRPASEWRHHDGLYLRLLESLLRVDPRWCATQILIFFRSSAESNEATGMTETLALLNRVSRLFALSDTTLTEIVDIVRLVAPDTNATQLESEYSLLRAEMLAGVTPAELLAHTKSALGGDEGTGSTSTTRPWSKVGRRAELRALTRAALERGDIDPHEHLDALLAEQDRTSEEHLCVVLGDCLAANPAMPSPLTSYARDRCRRALRKLPAVRHPDGPRPIPLLFVNALYGGRVEGAALIAAIQEDLPEKLWLHADGLLPLLVPAALAGSQGAARALRTYVSDGRNSGESSGPMGGTVRWRLQESAADGSRLAFERLIDFATATGDITDLRSALGKLDKSEIRLLSDLQSRLRELRANLVGSLHRGRVQSGYALWRLLLERAVDVAPEPAVLATALGRAPSSPLAISVLETALAALGSPHWVGVDLSPLTGILDHYIEPGRKARERRRTRSKAADNASRDRASEIAITKESLARRLLIGLKARHLPLPHTPARRLVFAREVFALLWDAGYDLDVKSDLTAFTACFSEVGPLLERLPDRTSAIDLILDTARRLNLFQPAATRWRKRAAAVWGAGIAATVAEATVPERQRLITELLSSDQDMAQIAVDSFIDTMSDIPPWLPDLEPRMSTDSRRRLRAGMKRVARQGGTRELPELYDAAIAHAGAQ